MCASRQACAPDLSWGSTAGFCTHTHMPTDATRPFVSCRSARSGSSSSSKTSRHMRKVSSGLQFDIELQPGQPGGNLLARRSILRLPPGLAVAALVEAKDPLESSIGMQVRCTASQDSAPKHSVKIAKS